MPTARERGLDAEQFSQLGAHAPRGTHEPVLDRVEEARRTGLADPAVRGVSASSTRGAESTRMAQDGFATYAASRANSASRRHDEGVRPAAGAGAVSA